MNKTLNLLGLAKQAGKTIDGEKRVLQAMGSIKPLLLFIATDAGDNIMKKIHDKASTYQVPFIQTFTTDELSKAIGKENRKLVLVIDAGFVKNMKA